MVRVAEKREITLLTLPSTGRCKVNSISNNKEITMTTEATLRVPAVHCGGCANTIKQTLQKLPGVSVNDIDTDTKLVHLSFEESEVSLDQIKESLEEVGFAPDE